MLPSYRVAPETPRPVVIIYRGLAVWVAIMLTAMMVGLSGISIALAETQSSVVTLDMSRPDNACVITRQYPVLGVFTEKHPLSTIRGTTLAVVRDKHGTASYGVQLLVDGSPVVDLSSRKAGLTVRGAQKAQIDAFLSGTAPTLHLAYNDGGAAGLVWLIPGIAFLFIALTPWQRARITVDLASRMVIVERSRWPLRATMQSAPIGEIARVDMRSFRRKGGIVYRVALVLASGQELRLVRGSTGAYGVHQRAADQITAALRQAGWQQIG